jgi:hypothetical protein
MKFTEAQLEAAIIELLETEGFSHLLENRSRVDIVKNGIIGLNKFTKQPCIS